MPGIASAATAVVMCHVASGTSTIESKTNFLAAGRGEELIGESLPLHIGRNTMVWQTTIRDSEGRRVAVVTQTQLVITPDPHAVR